MVDLDIDEIIRAMHEKAEDITYYLNKETGEIVYIDENIASSVEDDYEQQLTALEEWSTDSEDDDMYHEKIYAPNEEVDEKELIKRIRFIKQDDYEPIPTITIMEVKRIIEQYMNSIDGFNQDLKVTIMTSIANIANLEEIEEILVKHIGDKERWDNYYHDEIRKKVSNWLKGIGYDI
ncbi:MAG: UPF0158 family protein [Candidatus Delongbacteria bacterium]|nr:UPF0158 family protein [Candidatus Delongbacteria bacterium]MDD4205008.1 UPF0158 family protein [Candidatus Delongbacteria bacterium]